MFLVSSHKIFKYLIVYGIIYHIYRQIVMEKPLISVVMPVYNSEKFLNEAITSILNQTYPFFELIIVNDGSTDNSAKIISSYKDSRIKVIKNAINKGLTKSLNRGFSAANGKYIARMDADDWSHPKRLEKQVTFMENNPDYGIVGSVFICMYEDRLPYCIGGVRLLEHEELHIALLMGNIFAHGEVMIRKSVLDAHKLNYNEKFNPYEDYELWTRLREVTKFKVLPEVLYSYLINPEGMSGTRREEMYGGVEKYSSYLLKKHGLPKIDKNFISTLYNNSKNYDKEFVIFQGKRFRTFLQLNYQVFLYRLGFKYLRQFNVGGILLIFLSFLVKPQNWFRKILGTLPLE